MKGDGGRVKDIGPIWYIGPSPSINLQMREEMKKWNGMTYKKYIFCILYLIYVSMDLY